MPTATITYNHPLSSTTHYQPKYIHHRPPLPTNIHKHHLPPPPPPPPTNTPKPPPPPPSPSNTTYHKPKYIYHHAPPAELYPPLSTFSPKIEPLPNKSKIFSSKYDVFFSWQRLCVIKFWSVRFSNLKFMLHFTIFKVF